METTQIIQEIKELHKKYEDSPSIFGMRGSQILKKYNYYVHDDNKNKITRKTLYNIIHDITESPKCEICGKDSIFRDYKRGYSPACSASCMTKIQFKNQEPMSKERKELMVSRVKATKLERYGDENYNNSENNKRVWTEEQKEKSKKTCLKRYGVENISQLETIKDKKKKTTISKYGKLWPNIDQKKVRKIMEMKGRWIPLSEKEDFLIYRQIVDKLTLRISKNIKNIELRGVHKYHIDHRYSVYQGFKDNICAHVIASEYNCEMIPCKENWSKNSDCSITKEDLFKNYK